MDYATTGNTFIVPMAWYGLMKNRRQYRSGFSTDILKGFDGEITDAATGWQFLGRRSSYL